MKHAFTLIAALSLAACSVDEAERDGGWDVVIDTSGDTITVRTRAGSLWRDTAELVSVLSIGVVEGPDEYIFGDLRSLAVAADGSVYAYDRHVRRLRKYSGDGRYLDTFGREGGGPGEYRNPDGGLSVLSDGRVLLRDPANARITVYADDGECLSTWSTNYSFSTSDPLFLDTAGNSYAVQVLNPRAPPFEWRRGLVVRDKDGNSRDTIALPTWDDEPPQIIAGPNTQRIPFAPYPVWSVSPSGYVIAGIPTRYRLDLYVRPDQVLRIERENCEQLSVLPGERDEQRRSITANMRQSEPGWRWEGPQIPTVKPPYRDLFVGQDGRLWVQLHQRVSQIRTDSVATWVEPVAFDVFEQDGRYLGSVKAPEGMRLYPRPVARGDTVWAAMEDHLGVQRIARLVLEFRRPQAAHARTQ